MSNQERTVMFQMPSMLAGNLACVEGSVKGRSFELTAGTFVIGRLDSSDLHLPNEPGVSKTHAKIIAEGDRYVLIDCESRNGTIVNGGPVQRKVLDDGDEIRVCGCVLRFTQRTATATGIKVRNLDNRKSEAPIDMSIEDAPVDMTDPGGDAVGHTAMASAISQPSVSSSAPQPTPIGQLRTELEIPTFVQPSDSAIAAGVPPPVAVGRTLITWYAGGLLSALLFGGSASAVIVSTAKPATDAEALAQAGADAGPVAEGAAADAGAVLAVADADKAGAPADPKDPADPAAANAGGAAADAAAKAAADAPSADAQAADAQAAEAKAAEAKAAEAKAADAKAAEEAAAAKAAEEARQAEAKEREPRVASSAARRASRREREAAAEPAAEASSASAAEPAPSGKQFAATPESSRGDTLKARGGKVKTVEAKDGDTVSKGQVLLTFEEGASEGEIVSLKDRIATLEAIDSDEAREDLKAARAKLDALMSGANSPPVVATMSGVLSGFSVSAGDVLKQNATVGRISEGDTPRRVRVRVDRGTRPSRGQSVTLVTKSGDKPGTVASVSGRTVVVETGDIAASDVDAVRF